MPWDATMTMGTTLEEAYKYIRFLDSFCRLHPLLLPRNAKRSKAATVLKDEWDKKQEVPAPAESSSNPSVNDGDADVDPPKEAGGDAGPTERKQPLAFPTQEYIKSLMIAKRNAKRSASGKAQPQPDMGNPWGKLLSQSFEEL